MQATKLFLNLPKAHLPGTGASGPLPGEGGCPFETGRVRGTHSAAAGVGVPTVRVYGGCGTAAHGAGSELLPTSVSLNQRPRFESSNSVSFHMTGVAPTGSNVSSGSFDCTRQMIRLPMRIAERAWLAKMLSTF